MGTLRGMERHLQDTRPLMEALAKEMDVAFREHFRKREGEGNRQGWPSRHFWAREVMRYQTFSATDRQAVLSIASPAFLHKITGGQIRPKKGKGLAIPQHPLAYSLGGPKASGLDLKYVPVNRGKLLGHLVLDAARRYKGKNARGEIMYAIVRSVQQAADPAALPAQPELENRLARLIRSHLALLRKM